MTFCLHHFPSSFSVLRSAGFLGFFEVLRKGDVSNSALDPVSASVDLPSLSASAVFRRGLLIWTRQWKQQAELCFHDSFS